jgi:hypothetical protein
MDNFNLFTPQDRQDISYGACLAGTTLTGMAIGRFGGLGGLAAGAVVGLTIGLLTCRKLSPAIERKLFSQNEALSEHELLQALQVVRDETGVQSKSDAMYLFQQARIAIAIHGPGIRGAAASCQPMRTAASQVLSQRS